MWNKISELLPDEKKVVLTFHPKHGMAVMSHECVGTRIWYWYIEGNTQGYDTGPVSDPTHWMELPEGPKPLEKK